MSTTTLKSRMLIFALRLVLLRLPTHCFGRTRAHVLPVTSCELDRPLYHVGNRLRAYGKTRRACSSHALCVATNARTVSCTTTLSSIDRE